MFDWIKRKMSPIKSNSIHPETYELFFGPLDLCGQITVWASTYINAVKAGEKTSPAAKRRVKDSASSVREIWHDTRIEAAIRLISFPNAQLALLAQIVEQQKLLRVLLESHKYLRNLSPRGDHILDTAQGVLTSIGYLREQGYDACAPFAIDDAYFIRFIEECRNLRHHVDNFTATMQSSNQPLHKRPSLLIHVWWSKVNQLSKEVALAQVYGSDFRAALKDLSSFVQSKGQRIDIQAMINKIEIAKEPDDLLGT